MSSVHLGQVLDHEVAGVDHAVYAVLNTGLSLAVHLAWRTVVGEAHIPAATGERVHLFGEFLTLRLRLQLLEESIELRVGRVHFLKLG